VEVARGACRQARRFVGSLARRRREAHRSDCGLASDSSLFVVTPVPRDACAQRQSGRTAARSRRRPNRTPRYAARLSLASCKQSPCPVTPDHCQRVQGRQDGEVCIDHVPDSCRWLDPHGILCVRLSAARLKRTQALPLLPLTGRRLQQPTAATAAAARRALRPRRRRSPALAASSNWYCAPSMRFG
jgi:hypothetical protein